MTKPFTVELDTPADHRDVARMREEPDPLRSPAAEPTSAPAEAVAGAPAPANKLHEWAAAFAIMTLLGAIAVAFYFLFVRGVSL